MNQITAVILAAGEGKRIKPLITPKGLFYFLGKTMIEWIVDDFKSVGIKNVVAVVSPSTKELYKKVLPNNAEIIIQKQPTGMAGALLSARKQLSGPIIVTNSADIRSRSTFKQFTGQLEKTKASIIVEGIKLDIHKPGGYFKFKSGQVIGIVEKPPQGQEPSRYFNTVFHYFKHPKEFLKLLEETRSKDDDVYELALDKLMRQGRVQLLQTDGYFAHIKYPYQILDVAQSFLSHRLTKESAIHPTAKIMSGAVIKNSYLGQNVIIGNNCLIRDSIIEKGSVVGYNTEIARSYVGPNSFFHCNYVGDSVIEGSTNMGSGARIANLRFDEKKVSLDAFNQKIPTARKKFGAVLAKGVKLGINTSIMPGVTIGQNSLIGSGTVLYRSVEANQKIFK